VEHHTRRADSLERSFACCLKTSSRA